MKYNFLFSYVWLLAYIRSIMVIYLSVVFVGWRGVSRPVACICEFFLLAWAHHIKCLNIKDWNMHLFIVSSVIILFQELKGHSVAQKEGLSLHPEIKHKATTSASIDTKKTQVGVYFQCNI